MVLTDNELGMIEQLTYLNGAVASAAGVNGFSGVKGGQNNMTIAEILECFDEESLRTLEEKGDMSIGFVSAKEWAGIIRYLKSSRMKDFVLSDTMVDSDGITLALCFEDKNSPNEAIVAFKGTSGIKEWVDNVEGLNAYDTECQKEALDFIERLPYDSITVTGHSKGGNKAMYVAITSDKVTRCVAYDGQGFSQEFIDKYWAEIQEKSGIIAAYSLSTDYVHTLLFPVPNANHIYCKGYGIANIGEHHSANSFFMTDDNGNIIVDENGSPIVVQISEDESIVMLHEFVSFVINNADGKDKDEIIGFLSELLTMVFSGDDLKTQEIVDYCLENEDTLALIIAYLSKYMQVYNLSTDDIDNLLETLGLNELNLLLTIADFEVFGNEININFNLANLITQLIDDEEDWIYKRLLSTLKDLFLQQYDIDIHAFWDKVNSNKDKIDISGGCDDAKVRIGTIRDFSLNIYNALMDCINRIEDMGGGYVSSWENYKNEEWYSVLLVGIAVKGINAYFSKLTETNQKCKSRVEMVFRNIEFIDNTISARISTWCEILEDSNTYITSISNSIG